MLQIDETRFLRHLTELGQVGRLPLEAGGGLDRRPFSAAERAARRYFQQQAEASGLVVVTDAAANLSARLPAADPAAKTLLLGSHLDTVPNGGPYDGALGVMAALEVLSTVRENRLTLPVHLEAIAFTDEEGRFGDFFGSQALAGRHTAETIAAFLANAAQYPEELAAMQNLLPGGLTPEAIRLARRHSTSLAGYVELHVEQGPRLEQAGIPIGIVDAIVGRRSMQLEFQGRSDHAGTTPLQMRADALVAAAHFIHEAPQLVGNQFPEAVVTCGNVQVKPGVYNVVPGSAVVLVEFRAGQQNILAQVGQQLIALAQAACKNSALSFTVHPTDQHAPVAMDRTVQAAIEQACQSLNYPYLNLSSGAGHDAQLLAPLTPTGMIFVPSKKGRSHSPLEDTAPADLVAGANVLLQTALLLATAGTH